MAAAASVAYRRPPQATRKARLTRAGRKKLMVKLPTELVQAIQSRARTCACLYKMLWRMHCRPIWFRQRPLQP